MLKKHKELALAVGVKKENVIIAENGNKIEMTKNHCKIVGKVQSGITLIDGFGVGDVGTVVLKDRQSLGDDGIVIISLSQYKNGAFSKHIELVTRGFIYNRESENLILETKELISLELKSLESQNIKEIDQIKPLLKNRVREFLYKKTNREPVILPIILES